MADLAPACAANVMVTCDRPVTGELFIAGARFLICQHHLRLWSSSVPQTQAALAALWGWEELSWTEDGGFARVPVGMPVISEGRDS